jgi:hypothetical protein
MRMGAVDRLSAEYRLGLVARRYGLHMISEKIRERLQSDPFVPFVIRTSSGHGYRVAGPDLAVVMKSKVFIAEPRSDRSATVSYLHISAVEDVDSPGGSSRRGTNGRPKRR